MRENLFLVDLRCFLSTYPLMIARVYYSQADAGGIVSPGGLSYIGRSKDIMGDIPGAVGIKRIILDEALVGAAKK